jgi:peptidoglycan hydrolase FlgJ
MTSSFSSPIAVANQPAVPTPRVSGGAVSDETKAKMKAAAQDFEAFYITQFISLMKSKNDASQFNGGVGEDIFRQELNSELGKNIAKSGGFGLADKVYSELLRQQEAR